MVNERMEERTMKGLLLKDLYILKGFGKQYGMILAFFIVYSLCIKSFSFMVIYFAIAGGTLVMSTMSYDESSSFNRFALTMPINIRTLIKAKYILLLIVCSCGSGISILMNIFLYLSPFGGNNFFEWEGILTALSVWMIANAVAFPFMFKLGVEKARYIYTFSVMIVGFAIAVILYVKLHLPIKEIENIFAGVRCIFLLVIGVLALMVSYFISVKVTKNKGW